jgi:hypothetical protein
MRVFEQRKEPGFRLNVADLALVAFCLGVSGYLWNVSDGLPVALVPAHVVATFFLFCNVFRIGRRQEFTWIAAYGATIFATVWMDLPFWWTVLPISTACTAAAVAWGWASGSYRGIGARVVASAATR